MKKIFVTGVTGQDGTILAKALIQKNYKVVGGYRRGQGKLWRHDIVQMPKNIELVEYEIGNGQELISLLQKNRFDEIYHFAGYSLTEDSFKYPKTTFETNFFGVLELLEAVRIAGLDCKIFIAGSSEIFGSTNNADEVYDENSTLKPSNPYGVAHSASKLICDLYRTAYQQKIFYGILFNHESYLRDSIFLTKKLAIGFKKIKNGEIDSIEIGSFESKRDWGSAQEFIDNIIKLMDTSKYGDYIFASGVLHSVQDIVREFAYYYGFNPSFELVNGQILCRDASSGKVLVKSANQYLRKIDTIGKKGSTKKLAKTIEMTISSDISKLVKEIIEPRI
jgi:GDPmannose 4,6-dehydratase